MKNIVLIDADSICYLGNKDDTLPQILEKVDYKINAILEECKADYYCLFISKGRYFRYDLTMKSTDSMYKGSRTYDSQPYKKVIKAYLEAQWGAVSYPNVEADDIIAWIMNKEFTSGKMWINTDQSMSYRESGYPGLLPDELNVIMAAVDKDLLKSIPGKHLNYNKKTGPDTWEMVWIETSEVDAVNNYAKTLLTGDSGDGISGLKGIGSKRADKLLESWTEGHVEAFIVSTYLEYYKGDAPKAVYEFQKTYRLLHLLDTDEDWMREVGYIPELPTFREFKTEVESTPTFE